MVIFLPYIFRNYLVLTGHYLFFLLLLRVIQKKCFASHLLHFVRKTKSICKGHELSEWLHMNSPSTLLVLSSWLLTMHRSCCRVSKYILTSKIAGVHPRNLGVQKRGEAWFPLIGVQLLLQTPSDLKSYL